MIFVAEKLAAKAAAGVDVQLVVESTWWESEENTAAKQVLEKSRVKVYLDTKASGLMHNKFFVVDGKRVWTGSTNLTQTCLLYNPNNAVRVENGKVAANFEVEFAEQRAGGFGKRGSGKPNTPYSVVQVDRDTRVTTLFSPEDEPVPVIVDLIDKSRASVDVCCFVFSGEEISEAVIRAHKRGVKVRVLLDNLFSSPAATARWKYVPATEMRKAGIECRYDDETAKLHNKVVIVDGRTVVTGSFNLSANAADNNDENLLVIESEAVGRQYAVEFARLWDEYTPDRADMRADELEDRPGFEAVVLNCTDANTLLVRPTGHRKPVTIRLIGLRAPVKATREHLGQEPWGTRAQQYVALKAIRETVRVEFDVRKTELGQSTLWGYVWLKSEGGDELLNELLLKEGHAVLDTRVPNVNHVDRLREAHRIAREGEFGVWNPDDSLPESPAEFEARAAAAAAKGSDVPTLAEFQPGCIVANRKTKKYHAPGGRYYKSGQVSKNAVFFVDEATAVKAGYVKSVR